MKVNVTGGWVELREPEEVPEKLRRPIINVTMMGIPLRNDFDTITTDPDNADPEKLAAFLRFSAEFGDLAAMAFLREWSFPEPITSDNVQNLPGKVFDEIQSAIAPLVQRLLPNFGVDPDPKAPTENFSD